MVQSKFCIWFRSVLSRYARAASFNIRFPPSALFLSSVLLLSSSPFGFLYSLLSFPRSFSLTVCFPLSTVQFLVKVRYPTPSHFCVIGLAMLHCASNEYLALLPTSTSLYFFLFYIRLFNCFRICTCLVDCLPASFFLFVPFPSFAQPLFLCFLYPFGFSAGP